MLKFGFLTHFIGLNIFLDYEADTWYVPGAASDKRLGIECIKRRSRENENLRLVQSWKKFMK